MAAVEICDLDVAEPTTASEIVAVQQSGYEVEADIIGFKDLPPLLESADDVALLDSVMLGARDGTRLIGVVGYRRSGDVVDVDRLVVDRSHFRHGVATALLTELHRRETTARRFQVSTGSANVPAIRLYQHLDYRIERTEALPVGLEIVHLCRT